MGVLTNILSKIFGNKYERDLQEVAPFVELIKEEYDNGADATVGSMLRIDKEISYPVDFENPREKRGGNVWQHLRSFRKALFDRIKMEDLQIEGEWVDIATDWLYMLPAWKRKQIEVVE